MTATASSSTDGRASQSTNQNRLQAGENHLIELDLKKARPRNNWTARQRILLCCMRRFFNLSRAQETAIFNAVFLDEVRPQGSPWAFQELLSIFSGRT